MRKSSQTVYKFLAEVKNFTFFPKKKAIINELFHVFLKKK